MRNKATNFIFMRAGFGLIEVIIGASIIAISSVAVFGALQKTYSVANNSIVVTQASFLAEEGIEAIRTIRDDGWNDNIQTITNGAPYYLSFTGSAWQAVSTPVVIDNIFYRTFVLEDVYRNATTDDIEPSGTLDPNTKKVSVTVSWLNRGATSSRSIDSYITNLFSD